MRRWETKERDKECTGCDAEGRNANIRDDVSVAKSWKKGRRGVDATKEMALK